jgi:HAD superfamily hydrolase (TIGR01509 family)
MPTSAPAAVLWDMDGTLLDSEKIWTVSLADTARWLGGELSQAAREQVVGSNMARTLTIMFDDLGLDHDADRASAAAAFLTARTGELFAEGLVWRPGAQDALHAVEDAGWPMALVTNTERALTELALGAIGRARFAATVCGDEVPHAKPAPDPYLRAAQLLGVTATECLAVEDSPTGTLAAVRAGASVLVVPCELPVPAGPGQVHRESLIGFSASDVLESYTRARAERAA